MKKIIFGVFMLMSVAACNDNSSTDSGLTDSNIMHRGLDTNKNSYKSADTLVTEKLVPNQRASGTGAGSGTGSSGAGTGSGTGGTGSGAGTGGSGTAGSGTGGSGTGTGTGAP